MHIAQKVTGYKGEEVVFTTKSSGILCAEDVNGVCEFLSRSRFIRLLTNFCVSCAKDAPTANFT